MTSDAAPSDDDWAETKASLAHYDRTGEFVDAHEALAALRARLIARLDFHGDGDR